MSSQTHSAEEDRLHATPAGAEARVVVSYLVAPEAEQYIPIMEVLESSITDLTPHEVGVHLAASGIQLEESVIEARLTQLQEWGAASAHVDTSRIFRFADLLAKNWRYTATPTGRHVQRFYRTALAGTRTVREIPLKSLARVVDAAETLAGTRTPEPIPIAELIQRLFVSHDDLDAALVGAEDSLAGLVDRFDLNKASAAELKTLLVSYATHVAAELERGAARAYQALEILRPQFAELATSAVWASDARDLIERGALVASRGGRQEDWDGLLAWFDPVTGRSARFALRLVRALPGMHVNLRRLHSSSGTATSRSRALALAKACMHPTLGPAVLLAALGDHSWRKLHGEAEDFEPARTRPWREGPRIEVPELLRITGRAGARGRPPADRDDTSARDAVAEKRRRRATEHAEAVQEVLHAAPGAQLSERAARVALASLTAAARGRAINGRRTAIRDGLACTLFYLGSETGALRAPTWRVLTPGRVPVFHLPGTLPQVPQGRMAPEPDDSAATLEAGGEK
ncbi:DUF2397 domain-containing protein [Myxococcus virescens]|uniref:TIGR02677 family protein n=1 Tax=Myxococcus virescens TaxID=83456 RepID=A0A511H570_9BACT|nr:DUF2397 domain-containing protein [Myxococcus virescens]GEL68673.1 hypothetical protein MVI01_04570 [Myxococcus virescens]SDE49746.1 TIGR02677 family protein [Myxococcus virescens]